MTPNAPPRPARQIRRALFALMVVATIGVALHLLAPSFNGVKIAGLPLGYEMAAQIGPILLALIALWMTNRKVAS